MNKITNTTSKGGTTVAPVNYPTPTTQSPPVQVIPIVQMMQSAPTFNLPILTNPEEASAIIAENMEGMGAFRFEKIKIPSGGGIAFEVQDENGEPEPVKELRGILLDKFPFHAWYEKAFDEKGADDIGIPDCFSEDGVKGSGFRDAAGRVVIPEGQLCEKCPKGQWGSSRKGGRGKDCSDKIRIHLLMEGDAFPKFIDAPPTSLANFKQYIKLLSDKVKSFYGVVTTLKLEKTKSDGGIDYSRVVFAKATDLTDDERKAIKSLIQTMLPAMRRVTKDSIAEPPAGTGAGVGDGEGETLSFDGEENEPY